MGRFDKGAAVAHAAYGKGTVTARRHNGYEVRVSFGRYSLWIPVRELEPASGGLRLVKGGADRVENAGTGRRSLDQILRMLTSETSETGEAGRPGEPPLPRSPAAAAPAPVYTPGVKGRPISAAVALESFRLGIVPEASVAEWTVGRDREVESLGKFLRDDGEGAVVIEGAYGAGKTHLLARMAGEALDLGFAAARAGFDPSEAAAAFPKKAYRRLVKSFRAPLAGGEVGFRGFLEAVAAHSEWKDAVGEGFLLGPFLDRLAAGRVDERDWDWAEGRGPGRASLPTLHDFTTCANLYCNVLSGLGRAAEMLGLNGVAILLDEAEVAGSVMYRYHLARGLNFFRGLMMTANDEHDLVEEGVERIDGVTVGSRTGLVYSGHNPARYSVGIPSFLKVGFALTPGTLRTEFLGFRDSIRLLELESLSPTVVRELFDRICERFQAVYGTALTPYGRDRVFRTITSALEAGSTRGLIKAAVEALDSMRFFPGADHEDVLFGGTGPGKTE